MCGWGAAGGCLRGVVCTLTSGLQMERSSAFTVHYHFPSLANHYAKRCNVSTRKCFHFLLPIYRCVCVCVHVHVRVCVCLCMCVVVE